MLAGGQNVVTAVAIDGDGELPPLPTGVSVQTREQAFDDVVSRTADAKGSIDAFKVTLWVLAVVIVGAVLYLAAIERVRDFAIFKATGAGNLDLVFGLGLQAAFVGVGTPDEAGLSRPAQLAVRCRLAGDPRLGGDRCVIEHRRSQTRHQGRSKSGVRVMAFDPQHEETRHV